MRTARAIAAAIFSLALWVWFPKPAKAQIASYVDGHGQVVYINADSPTRRSKTPTRAPKSLPGSATSVAPPSRLAQLASTAAKRNHLDPALVRAVIENESGWNPYAISRKGAEGLMQLIPSTAERYGVGNVFDPAQNVEGGVRYLRDLLARFHGDLTKALAAYNAGESAVERSGGVPDYPETRTYVEKVTDTYFRPGSGRTSKEWAPPSPPIRRTVNDHGRVIFTNE